MRRQSMSDHSMLIAGVALIVMGVLFRLHMTAFAYIAAVIAAIALTIAVVSARH